MKLIKEHTEQVKYLVEEKLGKGKEYFIEGVFLQSNLKNRNGRVYPVEILDNEVKRYNDEYVNKNRAFGELGHPDSPTINLDRVSHMIKSLRRDGDNFIGKAKIMDTPYGKIVKSLIDEGATLGVSSRGMGSLDRKGDVSYVGKDFTLATAADIVADPSAPNAFVEGVMESKEWVMVDGRFVEKDLREAQALIRKTSSKNLEEAKLKVFMNFLSKIK
ncbi:primosomal protein [bacterium]|nr:primosomal protein [bacterium]